MAFSRGFTSRLTSIILWRFLLNLQAANRSADRGGMDSSLDEHGSDSLLFERVVGSISASIDFTPELEEDQHSATQEDGLSNLEYE